MNRLVLYVLLAALLVGCGSDGLAALRPGAGRLGAKIAPTTAPEIAPTSTPAKEIAPTTGDDQRAILGLATAAAEIAPTTSGAGPEIAPTTSGWSPKLHQQRQVGPKIAPTTLAAEIAPTTSKLHQQDMAVSDERNAIYGGGHADRTWIAVLLFGIALFSLWAILMGRAVARRLWGDR